MQTIVQEFLESKNSLMRYFDCEDNYYIKALDDYDWRIKESEGLYFLTYWKPGGRLNECVIVRKDKKTLIFRQFDYTMIICIECVKIALILKNSNEV